MYEFHYHYFKSKYGSNLVLLITDTDSLMYEIKTENAHKDFGKNQNMFDFSNYSTKSKYYDDSNKLVVGEMKGETGSVTLNNFLDGNQRCIHF